MDKFMHRPPPYLESMNMLLHLGSTEFHTLTVKDGSQWVSASPGPLVGGQSREATCLGLRSRRGPGGPRNSPLCWLCSAHLLPGSPTLAYREIQFTVNKAAVGKNS